LEFDRVGRNDAMGKGDIYRIVNELLEGRKTETRRRK